MSEKHKLKDIPQNQPLSFRRVNSSKKQEKSEEPEVIEAD